MKSTNEIKKKPVNFPATRVYLHDPEPTPEPVKAPDQTTAKPAGEITSLLSTIHNVINELHSDLTDLENDIAQVLANKPAIDGPETKPVETETELGESLASASHKLFHLSNRLRDLRASTRI